MARRISRAKVAAWAVHRETLRQEDKRPTTRDTFSSLSGFSTLLILGFRNFHREAFTKKIYGESMDRRGWLNIAAKRWKLGDVTCGHGLVISSFIADRDWVLEITSFLGFGQNLKRGVIIWDIYLFRTANVLYLKI